MTPTPWAMDAARALVPLPGFVIGLSDIARALDAAHAQGRRDERADVVAWLREQAQAEAKEHRAMFATDALLLGAAMLEKGAHVPAAADAGRADRGEG